MSWLTYTFIGLTIWSVSAVADRFFLIRQVRSKRFYVVVPALVQSAATLICTIPFSIPHAELPVIIAAIASGIAEVMILYFLYVAVSAEEVSRAIALPLSPLITLVAGWLLLHESLSGNQLIAFALFLIGGFFLATRIKKGQLMFSNALRPLLIGAVLSSAFTLLLRFSFVSSDFWTGFFYSRMGFLLAGVFVLWIYRAEISHQWRTLGSGTRFFLVGNQVISLSGHACYFFAISLSSAALVQSVSSAQSAIIFFFAVLVSLWRRDILEESIAARDLTQKGIGVLFVVIASYLLSV